MRRFVLVLALLTLVTPLAQANAHPAPSDACANVFCAGAGRGDITPPVTTPMWGYTAREFGDHAPDPLSAAGDKLAAGDVQGAVDTIASDSFVQDKLSADTEGYCKTFECNHGIQTRLFANAFVLRDAAGTKLAMVEVDLGGLPAEVHQGVADAIRRTGIDREHLLISATHTHQGPGGMNQYQGYALLGGDEYDPRVFQAAVDGISRAIRRADATLTPAKLAWGQRDISGNHNRDTEQWCLNIEIKPTCAGPENNQHWTGVGQHPNNATLTMIRLDALDGRHIGVVTNFANHGTIGDDNNLLFSGDNQAYVVRDVEAGIRAAGVPGACVNGHQTADPLSPPCLSGSAQSPGNDWPIDALLNASQGDQSPDSNRGAAWNGIDGGARGDYAAMEGAGPIQATPTLQLWRDLGDGAFTTDVTLDSRFEFLCFCGQQVAQPGPNYDGDPLWDHVSPYAALGQGDITMDAGTSSPVVVPTQGRKLPLLGGAGTNPSITRLQMLRINDLYVAAMPGEPTVQLGRHLIDRVVAASGGKAKAAIIAGLANDYDSYFTTQEEYRSYRYEASFSLFGPQEGEALIEEHTKLAAALASGTPVPLCAHDQTCPVGTPDTTLGAKVAPDVPDAAVAVLAQPASSASRFETVSFEWLGGSPTAEHTPDRAHVQVLDAAGHVVSDDLLGTQTLLSYRHEVGQNRWTASWEIPRDLPTGSYRIRVHGRRTNEALAFEPYTLESHPIFVFASNALRTSISGSEVTVLNPQPSAASSFRYRDASPPSSTVTALVGETCETATAGPNGIATFSGPVSAATAVDAAGNTTSGQALPCSAPVVTTHVEITDRGFDPSAIRIGSGTTITVTNADAVARSVTSDDGTFDTGLIAPGAGAQIGFKSLGTYHFHDSTRPYVVGEAIVE